MYGTVARVKIKPGKEQEFLQIGRQGAEQIPGVVSELIYKLDGGANEYILAVAFESKEAYRANADSPEQHERYLAYRELMETEPEWNDGEVVYAHPS